MNVQLEPWTDELWADLKPLAEAHSQEVDGGVEPKRKFALDLRLMRLLADAGSLIVVVARQNGQAIGYFTWNIAPDVESEGLVIAQQGAWYVAPGHPRAAVELFECSMSELRACGVECVFPHHRTQGRGADIGKFFLRRGAKLIQHSYCLWIGE